MKSSFLRELIQNNLPHLRDLKALHYLPGMLFNSTERWWKEGKRPRPHEGLDICLYENSRGEVRNLGQDTLIPALFDGTVLGLIEDFMGRSIFVKASLPHLKIPEGSSLLWAYGHIRPLDGIGEGSHLRMGEPVGRLAMQKKDVLPHLHVTVAVTHNRHAIKGLSWESILKQDSFTLLDPIKFL